MKRKEVAMTAGKGGMRLPIWCCRITGQNSADSAG